jgi:hypothetical protein
MEDLSNPSLNRLILYLLGIEKTHSFLKSAENIADAIEAYFSGRKEFETTIPIDKTEDTWQVAIRGIWFKDLSLKKSITNQKQLTFIGDKYD